MKKFILTTCSLLFLTACSNEVKQESTEKVETNEEVTETVEVTEADTLGTEQQSTPTETDTAENETTETSQVEIEEKNVSSAEDNNGTATNEIILNDIKEDEIFTYYSEAAKNIDISETTVVEEDNIPTFKVDEAGDALYLPVYEENSDLFAESLTEVALKELEEKEIVSYVEEPITAGTLVVVEMDALQQAYPAISYSLKYEGTEYPIMLVEEDPSLGLILIENSQSSLENIANSFIIVMK